jgi:hypothetical protein
MKFSYLSLFAILLALMPLNISAGDMGFYTDYAAALKMEKPELRVNKLLDMLDKYPERAENFIHFFRKASTASPSRRNIPKKLKRSGKNIRKIWH